MPFPDDPEQVVYVWVDALVNYLTGLGYPDANELQRYWAGAGLKIHVIGKNVWKFHAVYWPALLLSAGLDVPDRIFAHGFLTEQGRKISKSSGKASDPEEFIAAFGADAIRYYLVAHTRPYHDTDFTVSRLEAVYRADLANNLGNLCSRLTALCEKALVSGVEPANTPTAPEGYHEHLERFRFDRVAAVLWEELDRLNREVAEGRPWDALKRGQVEAVGERLTDWAERLHAVAYWLGPLLPTTSAQIIGALTARKIRKCRPLFPKLD